MNNNFEYVTKGLNVIKQSHFQCSEDLISHILDCDNVERGSVIELFKPRKKFMEFYEVLDRKFFPEIERDIDIIIPQIIDAARNMDKHYSTKSGVINMPELDRDQEQVLYHLKAAAEKYRSNPKPQNIRKQDG